MSCSRHCAFYKALDGRWYMELAAQEHAGREEATAYGPFPSEEAAHDYRRGRFVNPGGATSDDSGTNPVPLKSPNGSPVECPR